MSTSLALTQTLRALLCGAALWAMSVGWNAARAQSAGCPPAAATPSAEQIQAAKREARDRGFLWRVSKNGRSSYLYGTLHVGKLDWAFPGPRLRDALHNTDTLAVEIDLTDPALAPSLIAAYAAAGSGADLPPAIQQRLSRQIAAACLPELALAALHPMMQAVTLSILAGRWEGLDPAYAQEVVLGSNARARQQPIVALETLESQLAVLIPRDPQQMQRLLARTLDQLEGDRVRPVLRRLAAVWESGRLSELENYAQWCDCAGTAEERAFLARLNDQRNPSMAERIDALHRSGKRVLAAVGSLHMTGARGLPRLLAERGYAVERLTPARR
jgi:uncharacterized protein YbaP (TraB family)